MSVVGEEGTRERRPMPFNPHHEDRRRPRDRGMVFLLIVLGASGCATTPSQAPEPSRTEAPNVPARTRPATASAKERDLYQAAITVVEASLRLHETDRAKEWLSRAPAARRGWEWYYLSGQSDASAATIQLEGGTISDLATSPDGRLVAAAMANGKTHLLDAGNGAVVRTLEGHTAAVWTPAFTGDGRRLATASSDGTARVWDVATGEQLLVMPDNGQGVAATAWSPHDTLLAVSSWGRTPERGVYGTLNLYDARTGQRLRHIEHGTYPIASLTWSADGTRLIGGTWDWNLLVWDTRTWAEPRVLPPPVSPDYKRVEDFALSPDGSLLAVAYADGRARIWDIERLEVVQTLHSPTEGLITNIADIAYLPGGDVIATVGGDLTVRLWDAATGGPLAVHHGHERPILTVAVGTDGRRLYSAGSGGNVRIWDLEVLDPARTTWRIPRSSANEERGAATVYDIAFDPDHKRAVVATYEGWLRIIDVATGREVRGWRASDKAAVGVDWSPDGRWIASTGNDGRTVLWDAASGTRTRELLNANRQLLNVAFSPDGSLIASPGSGASVEVFRVPSGVPVATLTEGGGSVSDVVWSSNGALAATYTDGKVRLWEASRGTLVTTIDAGPTGTPAVAFDPTGQRIAVMLGRSMRVWDVTGGAWRAPWAPRSGSARSISWSPDGERIAAAMSGNMFQLWDSETGDVMLRLPQTASAWLVTWTRRHELVLVPLDETVRILRAPARAANSQARPADVAVTDSVEWRRELAYLADRGGIWLASNAEYRTAANGEPREYGMRYWMGLGGTAQHGCLWGASPGREPMVFWNYFTAWDPTRGQLLVQQSGANGVIGIGYDTPGTGRAEQTFIGPDGATWDVRHMTTALPPDSLVTRSLQRGDDGDWHPRRSYRWVRQPPGTPTPC